MHAVKCNWIGQTFALAKVNDPGVRKSRLRRSKEERKAMVESFIKRYQKVNNGNFPSLNLTHKEVGGSFYTVREIVREIIQENRVLGPSNSNSEERKSTDQFMEQYPLGSISMEPPTTLSISSDETNNIPEQHNVTSDGVAIVSEGVQEHQNVGAEDINRIQVDDKSEELTQSESTELQTSLPSVADKDIEDLMESESDQDHLTVDKAYILNGIQVDVESGASNKPTDIDVQVVEPSEANKDVQELVETSTEVTLLSKNVVVETFPPRPLSKTADSLDSKLSSPGDGSDLTGALGDEEITMVEEDVRGAENLAGQVLKKDPGWLLEKAIDNLVDPSLRSLVSPNTKQAICDSQDSKNAEVKGFQSDVVRESGNQMQSSRAKEAVNHPVSSHVKTLQSRYADTSCSRLTTKVVEAAKTKDDEALCSSNSHKANSPTLDRIKIHSWDGAAMNSAKLKTNPFWAVLKAALDAIVKFWSK